MVKNKGIVGSRIWLCVDNQNALKALAGRPTKSREHLRKCLKAMKILQQAGCKVRGSGLHPIRTFLALNALTNW